MCNLYRMTKSSSEIANLFGVTDNAIGGNHGELVYPGYPGLVVANGEVRTMTWGFPLSLKGKSGQLLKPKPVNNTRTDKLDSGFWRPSFESRRCLIPLSAFAEAEGLKGKKTRTWLSMANEELFTCAGIWRDSAEWGPVYSMVMTEASEHTNEIHDRMPVIIPLSGRKAWLFGDPGTARYLCVPYGDGLMIERTGEPWVRPAGTN